MSAARSADRRLIGVVLGALTLTVLTGCVETTQTKSARIEVQDNRLLASEEPVRVARADGEVSVLGVALVHGAGGRVAVAVRLRNDAARSLTDLPISVGVRAPDGRITLLNAQANLPYFQTHIGAVAPGSQTTWVFTGRSGAPAGTPVALVGAPTFTVAAAPATLPQITTAPATPGRVTITNRSGIPQYALTVYASAEAAGRVLAAGQAAVAELAPGARATVAVPLVGDAGTSSLQLDAPPTLLR